MSNKDALLRLQPGIWGRLKRALTTAPDLEHSLESPSAAAGGALTVNSSNNETTAILSESIQIENNNKRQRLNIATTQVGLAEENSFMEMMKNLLSCSICLEVNKYSNQCQNGHLICLPCSGRLQQSSGDLSCPVCRVSLKNGLHRSLLAEQLTSELPAACRYCEVVIPVKHVKNHETHECPKRMVSCLYKLFGCNWIGKQKNSMEHMQQCSVSSKKVEELNNVVRDNIAKDFNLLQNPLQLWKTIISKIRLQTIGSRMIIRQTALTKCLIDDPNQVTFKSPTIRVPFACCSLHGFYLEIIVNKNNENGVEKLQYFMKSENRTKILLHYFIVSMKVDECLNIDVQDALHNHHFESSHRETVLHEIKIVSLDCDKDIPKLSEFESLVVEICFISERERSERGHGVLSANEEEETNGFLSTGSSDSNVVFTMFSPNTSSRSVNTSNTVVIANDEPSREEDIIITVTDNVENGEEVIVENREHYETRNNHSFVAVPSVFLSPTTSMFTYLPYQFDNNVINNGLQQSARLTRETHQYELENPSVTTEESLTLERSNNSSGQREPIVMSLYYPPQTIVSPILTNSVSPIIPRPSVTPRNIMVRPRHNPGQVFTRQPRLYTNLEDSNQVNNQELIVFPTETVTENDVQNINLYSPTLFRNEDSNLQNDNEVHED